MAKSVLLLASALLFFRLDSSLEQFQSCHDWNGNPTIDGNRCEASGEWNLIAEDYPNDNPSKADIINLWAARNGDNLCFAWERLAKGNGASLYDLVFDTDCNPGTEEFIIEFVWDQANSLTPIPITVTVSDGDGNTMDPAGSGFQGHAVCNDPVSMDQYAEFCVSLQDIIDAGFVDPCCGTITLIAAQSYAGTNRSSSIKDVPDISFSPVCIYVNEGPQAIITASTNAGCAGLDICFDASQSSDPDLPNDALTYRWDFSYDGSNFNAESTDIRPCHSYSFPGIYRVALIVSDRSGCSDMQVVSIQVPNSPAIVCSSTDPVCYGDQNGVIDVFVLVGLSPFTYRWTNESSSGTGSGTKITNLGPGTYDITITDANGCTATCSETLVQPPELVGTTTLVSNVSCHGESDGLAYVAASGGSSPYTYRWDNGETSDTASILDAGVHTVTITDSHDCEKVCIVRVDEPLPLTCSITSSQSTSCEGSADGSAVLVVNGGNGNYTYLWDNGETSASATGLNGGMHTVTVTDDKNCTAICSINITEPDLLIFNPTYDCDDLVGENVLVNLNLSGGTRPFEISHDGGSVFYLVPPGDAIDLTNGYSGNLILRDFNECTDTQNISIYCCTLGCPDDQTIECGDTQAIDDWLNNIQVIGCPNTRVQHNYDPNEFNNGCGETGSQLVTFELIDTLTSMIVESCQATLTVIDTVPPVIDCPDDGTFDLILECDGDYLAEINGWLSEIEDSILSRSSDHCDSELAITNDFDGGIPSVSCDLSSGLVVIFTVSDDCGNTSQCQAMIFKQDQIPPDTTGCNLEQLNISTECMGLDANRALLDIWNLSNIQTLTNCVQDRCGAITVISDYSFDNFMPDCSPNTGSLTVAYEVSDSCQNQVIIFATATITDTLPPDTSGCQIGDLNRTIECSGSQGNLQAMQDWHQDNLNRINTCVSDLCSDFRIESDFDPDNFNSDCGTTGVLQVEYRLLDPCDNEVSFRAILTIVDTTPPRPLLCPSDYYLIFGYEGDPSHTGTPLYDDCDEDLSWWYEDDSIGFDLPCDSLRTIYRHFYARDACGNINSSCVQQIVVECCIHEPIDLPADLFTYCGDSLNFPIQFKSTYPHLVIGYDLKEKLTTCGREYTVTYRIIDHCLETYSHKIVVLDTLAPELIIPSDTILECGEVIPEPWYEAWDDCSKLDVTHQEETEQQSCACSRQIIRTWTARDRCGNTKVGKQVITITDSRPPLIRAIDPGLAALQQGDTIYMFGCVNPEVDMAGFRTEDCCETIDSTYDEFLSFKNCDWAGFDQLWECGIISRDLCGNESRFIFFVAQIDTVPPEIINAPPDQVLECGDSLPPIPGNVRATDNCKTDFTPQFQQNIQVDPEDTTRFYLSRIWTATDNCGNESRHVQEITICGNRPLYGEGSISGMAWHDLDKDGLRGQLEPGIPKIQVLLYREEEHIKKLEAQAYTSDGSARGYYHFKNLMPGSYQVQFEVSREMTFTVQDFAAGVRDSIDSDVDVENGLTNILYLDSTEHLDFVDAGVILDDAFTFHCEEEVTVYCQLDSVIVPLLTDACDEKALITFEDDSTLIDSCGLGLIIRTWTAINCRGEVAECKQKIKLFDSTAPVINCNQDTVVVTDLREVPVPEIYDLCPSSEMLSYQDKMQMDLCDAILWEREWKALDCAGNTSKCHQFIILKKEAREEIRCPGDTTIFCIDDTIGILPPSSVPCDGQLSLHYSDSTLADECHTYQVLRTWISVGEDSTIQECTQNIFVKDTLAPVFIAESCPPDTVILGGDYIAPIYLGLPDYTENCAGEHFISIFDDTIGLDSICQSGTILRQFVAFDCSGNRDSSCQQTITILSPLDGFDPYLLPEDSFIYCGQSLPSLDYLYNIFPTFDIEVIEQGTPSPCGENVIRTINLTSSCWNYQHKQTIEVRDSIPPLMITPGDTTIAIGDSLPEMPVSVSDDCSIAMTGFQDQLVPGSEACNYMIYRIWEASDPCGNTARDTQRISVVDNQAPIVSLRTDKWGAIHNGDTLKVNPCEPFEFSRDDFHVVEHCTFRDSFFLAPTDDQHCQNGWSVSTWHAGMIFTDAAGNEEIFMLVLMQLDTARPVLVNVPSDTTIACADPIPDHNEVFAMDGCSPLPDVGYSEEILYHSEDSSQFEILRTWTARDACGNSTSATQIIKHCADQETVVSNVISGLVWLDENQDGTRNEDEVLVHDFLVELYSNNENHEVLVDSFRTRVIDTAMSFHFSHLPTGNYFLRFDPPDTMAFTAQDVGASDRDSDADPIKGTTEVMFLQSNQHMKNKDAGLIPTRPTTPSRVSFTNGISNGCDVFLEWQVIKGKKELQLMLERSTNGADYEELQSYLFVDSLGDSFTFQYTGQVQSEKNIYRLKLLDEDNNIMTSDFYYLESECTALQSSVVLYPNPVYAFTNLKFTGGELQIVPVKIMDQLGALVGQLSIEIKSDVHTEQIDLTSYPPGHYYLLFSFDGKHYVEELIKY